VDPTGEAICGGVCVGAAIGIGGRALVSYITRSVALGTFAWGMSNSSTDDESDGEQCEDEDDCSQITQTIASLADEVEMRYEDLLIDRHGLYDLPNPHPDHGSWYGHVHKYLEVQRDLQFQIAFAKSKGCPVDPNAEIWANEPPPSAPFSG
jgi:hypothetical protein